LEQKMSPLFSVIIPTRNRAALARESVGRVLQQSFTDFEVLVMDNSDTPELSRGEFQDPRVRLIPSDRPLSMPDNWERSLDHARGQYLMVISDKDMLFPWSLAEVRGVIEAVGSDIVTFKRAGFLVDGRLSLPECSGGVTTHPTKPVLHDWFRQVYYLQDAPMIYNSAVRRELVQSVRRKYGRVFVGVDADVSSGLVLAAAADEYALIDRIHALSYLGPWSTGQAVLAGPQKNGGAQSFLREFGEDPLAKHRLVFSVVGTVAETLLACRQFFPDLFAGYQINWARYVENALRELQEKEKGGTDVSGDRALLSANKGRLYSRWALLRGRAGFYSKRVLCRFGYRSLSGVVRRVLFPGTRLYSSWLPVRHVSGLEEALAAVSLTRCGWKAMGLGG
jgi:glycosyltransferase involved in cell wall biosynthesis